ncbi:MAG: 4Fe-4S dicluster domain-containing protein [Bacteroidota bacterium]
MAILQNIGLSIFVIALSIFTLSLGLSKYQLTTDSIEISNEYHKKAVLAAAESSGILGKEYNANIGFISDYKEVLKSAQANLKEQEIPEGVGEWDFRMGDWVIKDYVGSAVKNTAYGIVPENKGLFLFLTFGLGIIGGLFYIIPQFFTVPGIKHNQIYQSAMTRGLELNWRSAFLGATIVGVLVYGFFYIGNFFWPLFSLFIIGLIIYLVFFREGQKAKSPAKSASPETTAWLGVITGVYLIGFYVLLYWSPAYISNWVAIVDPVSRFMSGNPASQWFLYGLLYTVIVVVMGVRMIAKYRHNKYQIVRTCSVMFFQTAFAFVIPEILVRLNQPYFDFKNIWPLDYDFFFNYNLDSLINGGGIGIFMLVWGIVLIIIGVPLFTYFFGKRWYCSWVCGCGGLAETLGDPYRQLSDKSLRAWKFERWIIHGVLVSAVVMTVMVLYTYFSGNYNVLFMNSDTVRSWYGFFIGSAFSGVVGTGFYPLMGNRVWCRFGCPLAAYLGLVQRFQSRFRITTNGGQCISCGNCSTYCEMGIDVRAYAQRGQDILRTSCVGCGVCAAVCPRGVLRLENAGNDIKERTTHIRTIHVTEAEIGLLV